MKVIIFISVFLSLTFSSASFGQLAPSNFENIDYLLTFGNQAPSTWGDDDNIQIHFFVVPKAETKPIYIRIYDPETGGEIDTKNKGFNTITKFSLIGGKGAHSEKTARLTNPKPGYNKGKLISTKTFGAEAKWDRKWFNFEAVNPNEGEYSEEFGGYIFKLICEGKSGDDGNAYKYSMSYEKDKNVPIIDGNIFTYEMCFKLKSKTKETAHIYPFVTKSIKSITQYNFDADEDLDIRISSVARKLEAALASKDGAWANTKITILPKEINTTIDFQLIKKSVTDNDMTMYFLNQFNEAIPLFSVPIGGRPKFLYSVKTIRQF